MFIIADNNMLKVNNKYIRSAKYVQNSIVTNFTIKDTSNYTRSLSQMFFKTGVVKNFKIKGKYHCWSSLSIK